LEAERVAREAAGLREAARAALAAEDLGLAQSQVSAALQLSPADPESLALQEQIVAQQQQRAERQRISGEVARLSGAARAALAGQDYQAGLAAIEAALELSPDETELQSLREELLAQRAAAEERERVAVERRRLLDQVQSYRLAGDFPQALAALEQALESSAGDPELQTLRAELEAEQDAAIAAAETARQSGATEAADARAQQLVDSGTRQLELRDFASARLFFEAAVDAGAVRAATLLARTYDPLALRELGALGVQGDPEKALHWYAVGAEAGDPEAQERMSVLRRSFSPP
jgi:TPR repeat protein